MSNITYRDALAIAQLIYYIPALAIAIFLGFRHGFTRSSGWRFLCVFALARALGACLQLATISQPTNLSLYIGSATILNIAVSPLELVSLGLMSRLISSINKTTPTVLSPRHIQLAQLLNLIGLILGIVGGTKSSENYAHSGKFVATSETKGAMALFIVTLAIIAAGTVLLSFSISHAEKGEKRILLAIALSLPFLLVRLVYSAVSVFGGVQSFSVITGSETILLCMGLLMEAIMVAIYESFGLTLRKLPKEEKLEVKTGQRVDDAQYRANHV